MSSDAAPLKKPFIFLAMQENESRAFHECLSDEFNILTSNSFKEAIDIIKNNCQLISMIVCERRFNGSMMVDLLTQAKSAWHSKSIPFICVSMTKGDLDKIDADRDIHKTLELVVSAKGAETFIDYQHWISLFGPAVAQNMLMTTVKGKALSHSS